MNNLSVEEGNKIIAEFMGLPVAFNEVVGVWGCKTENTESIKYGWTPLPYYHSSWDWLMPVVEKIERSGYDTSIYIDEDGQQMTIWKQGFSYSRKATDLIIENDFGNKSKIKAVWLAVVEFIKWYNNQKVKHE